MLNKQSEQDKRYGKKVDKRGRSHEWDFKNQAPVCAVVEMPPAPNAAAPVSQKVVTGKTAKPVAKTGKKTIKTKTE